MAAKKKPEKRQAKPGDVIMIKIGNTEVKTMIDESGVQRIVPENTMIGALRAAKLLNLNDLAAAYFQKQISFEDYFEIYLNLNYSVSGFSELHMFEHLKIKNPNWE